MIKRVAKTLAPASAFADKLVQDVARHLDVVAGNTERRDDVLLGVAFLHQPGDILQVDVLVGHVRIVVVGCGRTVRTAGRSHCRSHSAAAQVVIVARCARPVAIRRGGRSRREVHVLVEEWVGAVGFGGGCGQSRRQLGSGD